mgnify:CR=1 FL=1
MSSPSGSEPSIDALEAHLASLGGADPIARIDALNALAWAKRFVDAEGANALASQARTLAMEHGYTLGQARAARTLAMAVVDEEGLRAVFPLGEEAMRLYAPRGAGPIVSQAVHLGIDRVPFPVEIIEVDADEPLRRDGYDIVPFRTRHGRASLGYALVEHERLGRFDPERARELGIPEGPLWGKLHRGQPVEVDGRAIQAGEVVGAARPGRRVVYTGDTRPAPGTVEAARGADLLIHEATFGDDEAARAKETEHATAREAARVAKEAGVRRLVLTHISPRYGLDPDALAKEAAEVFSPVDIAWDGMEVEVPFRDGDG